MKKRPLRILPFILFSRFTGTSLWFAGNAVLGDLQRQWELGSGALSSLGLYLAGGRGTHPLSG